MLSDVRCRRRREARQPHLLVFVAWMNSFFLFYKLSIAGGDTQMRHKMGTKGGSRSHFYPSATSRAIIRVKPAENASTPVLECGPEDISGISSSTVT